MAYIVTRPHEARAEEQNLWSHPALARRWDGAPGRDIEVLCFSNGEPRLTCGGEEIPLTRDDEKGYWFAVATPRPAPLVLETHRDGAVVARDRLGPRGEAVRLEAEVWLPPADVETRCAAAGLADNTVVQIECTLRDAEGEVAGDDREVSATVEGGELVGVENGALDDNTSYAAGRRRTVDGRVIVFVRPQRQAIVRLSVPGLTDVRVECSS